MRVADPQGTTWTIRRQWVPRYRGRGVRARLGDRRARSARRRGDDKTRWYDWIDIPIVDDSLTATIAVIVLLVVLGLFVVFGFPLLLAIFDVLLIVGATLVGVISRVLFRRPWTIEARSSLGEHREVQAVGWRNSTSEMAKLAALIEARAS